MTPRVSVIIPTVNRAKLLQICIESLERQTISRETYEIVIVDDGSTDETPLIAQTLAERGGVKYVRIPASGIAAAKNAGIQAASGSLVLFADDDDIADGALVEEHLKCHEKHPEEHIATLGYLTWDQNLRQTPIMKLIGDFGFDEMPEDHIFNFEFYWGGLSSCKRSFLLARGLFDPGFTTIIEDIELAYRIGLSVVFNRRAISRMIRPITFDAFCNRCVRQGRALQRFSGLHRDPVVQDYCRRNLSDPESGDCVEVRDAPGRWEVLRPRLEPRVARVRELEGRLLPDGSVSPADGVDELNALYRWSFDALKIKGFADGVLGHS